MRILILGAGAVGGYFGARLLEAGGDVTFLVRPGRAAGITERGLRITSPRGDFSCRPRLLLAGEAPNGHFDLALLACKAYDLDSAVATLVPAMGPDTTLLPLLNGIAHLERLDERFGRERVLGGVAHLAATLTPEGDIHHLNALHRLAAGPRSPAAVPCLEELVRLLQAARVDWCPSPDIGGEMWDKYIFLATLAGATCTFRGSVGAILAAPGGEAFIRELLDECLAIAASQGHRPDPERLAAYRRQLTEGGSPLAASMLRDLQKGGPTEGDHILGHLARLAAAAGLKAPRLEAAWHAVG